MIPHMSLGKGGAGEGEGQVRRMGRGCGRENKKEVEKARWRQDGKHCQRENCYQENCTKHVRC